jgi:hypothetical protein
MNYEKNKEIIRKVSDVYVNDLMEIVSVRVLEEIDNII